VCKQGSKPDVVILAVGGALVEISVVCENLDPEWSPRVKRQHRRLERTSSVNRLFGAARSDMIGGVANNFRTATLNDNSLYPTVWRFGH
jgi:hypothetical protein